MGGDSFSLFVCLFFAFMGIEKQNVNHIVSQKVTSIAQILGSRARLPVMENINQLCDLEQTISTFFALISLSIERG